MIFKRKAYQELLRWKEQDADRYAILLEGARRVGKSTLAEEFAKNEYQSYILIDFANTPRRIMDCFDDIGDIDLFFLRLQAETGVNLVPHESLVVFDEVQLFPRARQAIKHLVKDGRYHYMETGSLISIRKNVKDILIPSEEKKLPLYPMDYEEFLWAVGNNTYGLLRDVYKSDKGLGQATNRKLMRDFRIYMAVGGMPQAVEAYVNGCNFAKIDEVKRSIINLYEDDFSKIDNSGKLSAMYRSIPAQLSKNRRKFQISTATKKRRTSRDERLLYELINSKTVLISYNTTDPHVTPAAAKDLDTYKLYLGDIGLFVTLMFIDRPETENEIYAKLLSDKLPANLGYLYENAVAQMITASGRELYYHITKKPDSTHFYETDFLISSFSKIVPIEVKSAGISKHSSLDYFLEKYSNVVNEGIILSQKDLHKEKKIKYVPLYLAPFLFEQNLSEQSFTGRD